MITPTHSPLAARSPQVQYLTDRALAARFAVARTTVWRWLSEGLLPAPVHLTPGTTRWRLADIEAFEAQRLAASAAASQDRDTTTDPA